MAITLRHATTATQPNRGDGEIGKDEWNENHSLGMGGDAILGRASASDGPVQEIACTAAGRALLDDADAAAQRVTLGLNTTANQTFTASGNGAVARSVQSKIAETVSVKDFGAVGDGVTDDTAAIQAAIAASNNLYWPPGVYLVSTTLSVQQKVTWTGNSATLKHTHGAGYVTPLVVVGTSATGAEFYGLTFDHNAVGVAEASIAAATAYAYLCCFIVFADDVKILNCTVLNAWDSGFAIGRMTVSGNGSSGNPFSVVISTGNPQRVSVSDCRSQNCGVGVHSLDSNQQVGGGFNNLNGSRVQIDNCVAYECSTGFIADFGNGANTVFSSCQAVSSKYSSGWGFWVADGPNVLVGCYALFCEKDGFVIPYQSNGATLNGCYAYACGQIGFLVSSSKTVLTGCVAQQNSLYALDTYSGFVLSSTDEALSEVVMSGCVATGSNHRYGLTATGANTIDAVWIGGTLSGATADYDISTYSVTVLAQSNANRNMGVNVSVPPAIFSVGGNVVSYITTPVGDVGNGGVIAVCNLADTDQRLAFGYDTTNDASVVQSIHAGVAKKPLLLNPSGGDVMVGTGAYTDPARLGAYRLWVDGSGRLRIKNSAPTSDTDGTVVGTQS